MPACLHACLCRVLRAWLPAGLLARQLSSTTACLRTGRLARFPPFLLFDLGRLGPLLGPLLEALVHVVTPLGRPRAKPQSL